MFQAKLHAAIKRRGLVILTCSSMLSAGTQIAAGIYADADSWIPWLLIAIGVFVAILLALLAWAGTQDTKQLLAGITINGRNLEEHGQWISQFHDDVQALKTDVGKILSHLEAQASTVPDASD